MNDFIRLILVWERAQGVNQTLPGHEVGER
jgi:hypothetical protein